MVDTKFKCAKCPGLFNHMKDCPDYVAPRPQPVAEDLPEPDPEPTLAPQANGDSAPKSAAELLQAVVILAIDAAGGPDIRIQKGSLRDITWLAYLLQRHVDNLHSEAEKRHKPKIHAP